MSGDQAAAVAQKRGRPSDYNAQIANEICGLIIEGKSLRSIEEIEGFPSKTTVLRWVAKYPEFRDQYARACEARTNAHAEEILSIADDGSNDWMENNAKDNPGWIQNGEAMRRSQLRIDARKWLMSKLAPKKYGEKITHAGDEENPVVIAKIERVLVKRDNPTD